MEILLIQKKLSTFPKQVQVALAPDHAAFVHERDWFAARIAELGD